MTTTRRAVLLLTLVAGCSRGPSPTDTYVSYRQAFERAKAVEEVMPFMDKATRARVEGSPAEERKGGFELIKAMSEVVDVKVVKETITGETAVVEATGVDVSQGSDARATVQLVKEDGAWKIKNEKWKGDPAARQVSRSCSELVSDLKSTSVAARARAAAKLRQPGCAEAIPELVARLSDPSVAIRANASAGLRMNMRSGNPKDHVALLPAIVAAKTAAAAQQDTIMQINLQHALSAIGAPAIPHLVADLKSPSRDLRWGAAAGLGMMGAEGRDALPAIEAAAREEKDQTVGERLAEAIKEVKGS